MTSTMVSFGGQDARSAVLLVEDGARRRRQRASGRERTGMGATMSATFLGLLMVQGIGHAEEGGAAAEASGGHVSPEPGPATSEPVAGPAGGFGGLGGSLHAGITAASVSLAGVVDPSALTRLTGEIGGGQESPAASGRASEEVADVSATRRVDGVDGTTRIEMAAASAEPAAEAVEVPSTTDPDLDEGRNGTSQQGGDGDDTIIGTDNDDNLSGGGGDDLVYGGNGNDHLAGNSGDDELHGDAGDDELDGGTGNDLIYGGTGNDIGYGGEGDDGLYGGADNDELHGGSGNDVIDGGTGVDEMYGGSGRDRLVVDDIHDLAFDDGYGADGGGIDTLVVRDGYASSLAAAMPAYSPAGRATFVLDDAGMAGVPSGAESYVQQVHPFIENVSLSGSVDHDLLGDGRDNRLFGNDGDNRIYGGAGDDWLDGGAGDDWLQGGEGDDRMYGSEGDDVFVLGLAESGVDTVFDHGGVNTVTLLGATESRLQVSLDGQDLEIGYDGRAVAVIDGYVGHEGNFAGIDLGQGVRSFPDLLAEFLPRQVGGASADMLRAADGGEWLVGKEGNDQLVGSAAADRLEGGAGSDVMTGGAGNDTYLIAKGESGIDRIVDSQGSNTVELTGHGGSAIGGIMMGEDLWITADSQAVAIVEGHALHAGALAGIKVGDRLIDPNELTS
ncbi:MAG TPA: calcium-binding protein [Geminicoccaceae bacterium]|nr:calcium-binding protein [Geminicoccus sp.]HMU51002.1 calcium-binding protein [Geminicoccaceae bacterium]